MMKRNGVFVAVPKALNVIINVQFNLVKSNMGKCNFGYYTSKSSSEGSLNQHMKLKHPDVYAQTVKAEESSEYKNEQNEE